MRFVWKNFDMNFKTEFSKTNNFQVQVETIGEFGVFFILFFAGLEFSPDKIQKVWRVAVQGPTLIIILSSVKNYISFLKMATFDSFSQEFIKTIF